MFWQSAHDMPILEQSPPRGSYVPDMMFVPSSSVPTINARAWPTCDASGSARHVEAETLSSDNIESVHAARLLRLVLHSLDEDKAEEIVAIDLEGKSTIADCMVIASGRSQRQVGAIADHLIERLKAAGFGPVRVEGMGQCDWVVIDAGDVVVHLFRPEVRQFYNLEKMWAIELPAERAAI